MRSHTNFLTSITKLNRFLNFTTLAPFLLVQPCQKRREELGNLLLSLSPSDPLTLYKQAHSQIVVYGIQHVTFLANILLNVYSKAGFLQYARKVFDKMPLKNIISWSSMVSMYTRHGIADEAVTVFLEFWRCCDDNPNEYILASVIRAYKQLGCEEGKQIHCFVIKCGFDQDVYIGTTLVDYYSNISCIDEARTVFDCLSVKSSVTWTTVITGYIKCGRSEISLQLFYQMMKFIASPDKYVLSSVLSACSTLGCIDGGKQIHAYALRRDSEMDISISNVLLDFYAKCGKMKTAKKLFNGMKLRDSVSWTTMIAGFMQNSFDGEAIKIFSDMNSSDIKPDCYACTSVLTSCASLEALEQGKQVHGYSIKANLERDDFVKNGLIDMYAKSNSVTDARKVFDSICDKSLVSYNAMIEGCAKTGRLLEGLDIFRKMRILPNNLTFVSLLGASAAISGLEISQQIHSLIVKFGLSLDLFSASALIDVYSKSSRIEDAKFVFEEMKERDIVVWNSMFSGYNRQFENEEALKLYRELQLSQQKPDEFTFASLVTAISEMSSIQHGRQFHTQIIRLGYEPSLFLTSALIDMYAKCGAFEEACKTFGFTVHRDIACWNSIISAYAHHGEAEEALRLFHAMVNDGIAPNCTTFVGLLSACSHVGLLEDGLRSFELMGEFGIEPGTEHYACMVSLYGRAGKIHEAFEFIKKMPVKPAAIVWRSLLSACRAAGNVELGKYAAEMAISDDPTDSGSYILLSNIFAAKSMWFDVKILRERMDFNRVVKEPGCSWVEVNNEVNVFIARDRAHFSADLIYSVLDNLITEMKVICYVSEIID